VADELDVPIHTHASETAFENEFAGEHHGMRNIPFLDEVGLCGDRSVFAHGIHVTDDECERLAETGTAICHCPSSNLKLASGVADMLRYDDYGVQVALGADGAPCNNNLDGFTEMRLAALIQKPEHGPEAMPARRVLRLATLDGAKALGIDDDVGSLEVGKRADLVVLDLDGHPGTAPAGGELHSRIVYSAQRDNVTDVFCDGRQLVADGELVHWDLSEVIAAAEEARERLALSS
jgi:5-methylthioadenosine/S-adenosylhomocysteine deaminase